MIAVEKALVVAAWLAALVAVFGAASQHPAVMGVAGILSAVAAIAWGLVRTLADESPVDMAVYREQVWARRDTEQAELPYRAPIRTDVVYRMPVAWQHIEGGKQALWPSEIGGIE